MRQGVTRIHARHAHMLHSAITAHLFGRVLLRRLAALLQVALVVVLGGPEGGGGLDLRYDRPGVPGQGQVRVRVGVRLGLPG